MSPRYRNRLTEEVALEPEVPLLMGLWQVVSEGAESFLNTVPLASGDFLVPDLQGNWSLLDSGSGRRQAGSFGRYQLPEELEAQSLREMGRGLQALIAGAKGWLDWSDMTPVVPGMSEEVELQKLDRAIAEHLGHLKQVCCAPRAHLRVEIERVPVSRARRIPRSAAQYLASHMEDWERPTLRAVHPKRIQSLVRDDLLDIYENRVAARLVDNLLRYVSERIRRVRKMRHVFARTKAYEAQAALSGSHWRRKRVCGLWGEAIDLDERHRKAEHTLEQLERLRLKLLALMDTPLYRGVPRRAQVSDALILTNILSNDPHYRHVAQLWREWLEFNRKRTLTPQEVYRSQQEFCRGFDVFCLLLVIRALEQLGYEPRELEAPIRPGVEIALDGPGGPAQLRWEQAGVLMFSTEVGRRLRVVPMPALISASPDEGVARQHLESLARWSPGEMASTLVLHPGDTQEEEERLNPELLQRLHTLGNDLKKEERKGPSMLPVAPWDIGSVERVVRALRWTLSAPLFLSYPPEVECLPPEGLPLAQASGWLQQNGKKWVVFRPPAEHEWSALNTGEAVLRAQRELERAQVWHQQASEKAREAALKGRGTGTANAQKSESNAEVARAEKALGQAESFHNALERAVRRVKLQLKCPTCAKSVDPQRNFHPSPGGHFQCECPDCEARWGTRACGACGERFPMLLPTLKDWSPGKPTPGWVDQVLGGDVLAVPCVRSLEPGTFICSACGVCSCAQCQQHSRGAQVQDVPFSKPAS
ncbi:hypothetical protein [Hyalangium sp.]|uniref:hypothetical protein n=1 Tax=Hyalangium sp. TaxID=2028555 RepID=UPI002D38D830|nr:hypothetical protein [Hyalangium sp.]HYI02093.1 hypothetical protein [Hyalangium sp.]